MNAKDFLQRFKKLDKLIENKTVEAEQWHAIATNTTSNMSGERVDSSPNPHRTEEAIAKYMDLEAEAKRCVDAFIAAKLDAIRVIEQLSATEYDILHKIYVQDFTLQDVAFKYGRAYTWATTTHGRALAHVQEILNKRKAETCTS